MPETDGYVPGAGYAPEDLTAPPRQLDEIDPIPDPAAIIWERSVTTTQVDKTPVDTKTTIKHNAHFTIEPNAMVDVLADFSKTTSFDPRRVSISWEGGKLSRVYLSGPQRLKSGGVSDKAIRHREWSTWAAYTGRGLERDKLPAMLNAAITEYETKLAAASSVEAGWK